MTRMTRIYRMPRIRSPTPSIASDRVVCFDRVNKIRDETVFDFLTFAVLRVSDLLCFLDELVSSLFW